jgi:hypothetical protein
MSIDQKVSVLMESLQLGEGFFAEIVDPQNAVKLRAVDSTDMANKF